MSAQTIEAEVAEWIAVERACSEGQCSPAISKWSVTAICPSVRSQPGILVRSTARATAGCGIVGPPDEAAPLFLKVLPPQSPQDQEHPGVDPLSALQGISTGHFSQWSGIAVGSAGPGLSASTVVRLKAVWEEEFTAWNKRSLEGKEYVYVWCRRCPFQHPPWR